MGVITYNEYLKKKKKTGEDIAPIKTTGNVINVDDYIKSNNIDLSLISKNGEVVLREGAGIKNTNGYTYTGRNYGDYWYQDYAKNKDSKIYEKDGKYYIYYDSTKMYQPVDSLRFMTSKEADKKQLEEAKKLGYIKNDSKISNISERIKLDTAGLTYKEQKEYEKDLLRQQEDAEEKYKRDNEVRYGGASFKGAWGEVKHLAGNAVENVDDGIIEPLSTSIDAYKYGKKTEQLGKEYYKMMNGEENNVAELEEEIRKYSMFNQDIVNSKNIITQSIQSMPNQIGGAWAGIKEGGIGSLIGAGVGYVATRNLKGATTGAKILGGSGYVAGQTQYTYELEAGLQYKALLDMGVPEDIAKEEAKNVGVINALIESGESILDLVTLGRSSKLTNVLKDEMVKKYGTNTVKNWAAKVAKSQLQNTFSEAIEEGLQEKTAIESEKRAAEQSGIIRDDSEDWERIKESITVAAFSSFFGVGAVNVTTQTVGRVIDNKKINNIAKEQITKTEQEQNIKFTKEQKEKMQKEIIENLKYMIDSPDNITQNEQLVVNKEVENRISELENKGITVNNKRRNEIIQEVTEEFKKGYIPTDIIESTLGGEEYNLYKSILDKQKRYNELLDKNSGETTNRELNEIKALEEELKTTDINALKDKFQSSMKQKIQNDSYIQRTYQEKTERGNLYAVRDAEKIDNDNVTSWQQSFIDAKSNNTSKAHDFNEFGAKIIQDKNIKMRAVNYDILVREGKMKKVTDKNGKVTYKMKIKGKYKEVAVNGFKENGVLNVNLQSNRAFETTVGHELGEFIKDSDANMYEELKQIAIELGKADGTYNEAILNKYADVYGENTDSVTDEYVNDKLGELFTNDKFVEQLSVKPSLLKKILDEIKHLVELATAGSNEKRKLLSLQHKLENKFKEAYQKTDMTKESNENASFSMEDIGKSSKKEYNNSISNENLNKYKSSTLFKQMIMKSKSGKEDSVVVNDLTNTYVVVKDENNDYDIKFKISNEDYNKNKEYYKEVLEYVRKRNATSDNVSRNESGFRNDNSNNDDYQTKRTWVQLADRVLEKYEQEKFNKKYNFEESNRNSRELDDSSFFNTKYSLSENLSKRIDEIKNQRDDLRQQLFELRREREKIVDTIPNYSMFKQYVELEDINKKLDDNTNLSKQLYAEQQELEQRLEEVKEQEKNERIAKEEAEATPHKLAQNKIIQETNPMLDDYHTGIRSVGDIKTWQEAMEEAEKINEGYSWGDFSKEDAEKALKKGKIRVYSSYAIKNGTFVSTSYQQALDYAGSDPSKVHSREVALDSVAWISVDEGQYAKVYNYSLSNPNDIAPTNHNLTYSEDVKLEIEEAIAPINEKKLGTTANIENIAPISTTLNSKKIEEQLPIKEKNNAKLENYETTLNNYQKEKAESYEEINEIINKKTSQYEKLKNKNTIKANKLKIGIENLNLRKNNIQAEYDKKIDNLAKRIDKMKTPEFARQEKIKEKRNQYRNAARNLIGDTSTWRDKKLGISYQINTLQRNLRDIIRDITGKKDIQKADEIYNEIQGKYNEHEAQMKKESARIKQPYFEYKINKFEDEYIQILGEYKYNPDTTLTKEEVSEYYNKHKDNIDSNKVDKIIEEVRKTYDELFVRVNKVLREQGMKEIPYRKGYFPHFIEEKQGLLAKIFNWKTRNDNIPTDIAGITETFNPDRSWQSFNKQRKGDKTTYSFKKGLDTYVQGALDWIYHIEDIQKRRAIENEIRWQHSEKGVQEQIDKLYEDSSLDTDEIQERIDLIYSSYENPLNNFIVDFRNATNNLTGKKSAMDRGLEYATNRKVYSTMTNISNRVSGNMIGGSISAAMSNFIPITQSWGEVNILNSLKGIRKTIKSYLVDDGTIGKSTFLTNRLTKNENLSKTNWDKASEKVAILMEVVDNFSSQVVWRSKYEQNLKRGMNEIEAIMDADNYAERLIAGRSKGNMPTLFNSKNPVIRALTSFQLEVNNQYGYMFKDLPVELANSTKTKLIKSYLGIFLGAYVYNALYSTLTGRDAAFDPLGMLEDLFSGLSEDDEEDKLKAVSNFGEDIAQNIPFLGGLIGGGRVPISAMFPYDNPVSTLTGTAKDVTKLFDEEKSETALKNLTSEWLNPVTYLVLPFGGGQIRKSIEGLKMFDDDLPVTGNYTNSGNLRYPVEETPLNVLQATLFGKWANENAKEYFENGRQPLKPKQIQEYKDLDLPINEYWEYREGLKNAKTVEEKFEYINSLDATNEQKDIMINNAVNRKESIDMSNYDDFGSYEEFDYATKNPEKYKIINQIDTYNNYIIYENDIKAIKEQFSSNNGYSTEQRKVAVQQYIESLSLNVPQKVMLQKMAGGYSIKTYENYMYNYIESLEMTAEEKNEIHKILFD